MTPSKERRQGRMDYEFGKEQNENPFSYKAWSDAAKNWEEGWLEAEQNHLESLKAEGITYTYCPSCGQEVKED